MNGGILFSKSNSALNGTTYWGIASSQSNAGSGDGILRSIYGVAYSPSATNGGQAYGVHGIAGNSTNGYNVGVFGQLQGTAYGAAVYGAVGSSYPSRPDTLYAGYFYGKVKVVGTLWVNSTQITSSDERLKQNISTMDSTDGLFKLQPKKYKYKSLNDQFQAISSATAKSIADTFANKTITDPDPSISTKTHFGFLAGDLQKIYPELVYQSTDGTFGIDYQGLIPVIIGQLKKMKLSFDENNKLADSVKEMKNQIDSLNNENLNITKKLAELEKKINQCCNLSKTKSAEVPTRTEEIQNQNDQPWLGQNAPNPFSSATTVQFNIPINLNYKNAAIYIYDLQGVQKKVYKITTNGQSSIIINGYDFVSGIYLYSLIIDNKLIDTKQMVLTE